MDIRDEQWLMIESFIPKTINGTLTWSTCSETQGCFEWYSLDNAYWRALEGPSFPISFVPNLPSVVPKMGCRGRDGYAFKSLGGGLAKKREDRPIGVFYRCHLRGGK